MPYLGFSAGAAIAAERALVGGWRIGGVAVSPEEASEGLDELTVAPGIGLVDVAIDVHVAQWGTLSRLVAAVEAGLVEGGLAHRRAHRAHRRRRRAPGRRPRQRLAGASRRVRRAGRHDRRLNGSCEDARRARRRRPPRSRLGRRARAGRPTSPHSATSSAPRRRRAAATCPRGDHVLRAFGAPLADVRVLIVGQDPYPDARASDRALVRGRPARAAAAAEPREHLPRARTTTSASRRPRTATSRAWSDRASCC